MGKKQNRKHSWDLSLNHKIKHLTKAWAPSGRGCLTMLRENIIPGHWRHLASQLVACNLLSTHLHFYSERILNEITIKQLEKMWKSQKGFVFCRITNSTNLSPSKVLEFFDTLNSVLPKSAVTINTSRYFVISVAFVLPHYHKVSCPMRWTERRKKMKWFFF